MNKKTLEELKLDLIEIQAYRELQDESFCFDGINEIKNESNISEDAIYRAYEQYLIETINNKLSEETNVKRLI